MDMNINIHLSIYYVLFAFPPQKNSYVKAITSDVVVGGRR